MEYYIGTEAEIAWWQMLVRALIVFFAAIILARAAGKRTVGEFSAIDIMLWMVLGSIISRAITGVSPLFESLLAAFFLVGMHRLFMFISFYSSGFGSLVKGNRTLLVKNGEIQWDNMRKTQISEKDLMEAMRLQVNRTDLEAVKEAYLERSGKISFIGLK